MHRLINGDCVEVLRREDKLYQCIFADPPDNIGLGYNQYDDKHDDMKYKILLSHWLRTFTSMARVTWISFNSRWLLEFASIVSDHLHNHPELEFKPFVQSFNFGQNRKTDCANCHRPLWRFHWPKVTDLYPDQIKVESVRQKMGDKRAKEGGKVPGDVWDFCRVQGNNKQRRSWHPTQLHEGLVERAIMMSTLDGDKECDPFAGTGTTLRVCKRINRKCTLIDVDSEYCQRIGEEHDLTVER